jgi:large subunit ribosomal protein L25
MTTLLQTEPRTTVGTRAARKLRALGRIPANLQADADHPHVDLSIDEDQFWSSRRKHEHVYELDLGTEKAPALVRELGWDVLGERILHVEFRRVDLTKKTEVEVALLFTGHPKGVLTQLVSQVTISALPTDIPDAIEVSVADLPIGAVVLMKDLVMPKGVDLVEDLEVKVGVIVEVKELVLEPVAAAPTAEAVPGAVPAEGEAAAPTAEKGAEAAAPEKGAEKGAKKPADKKPGKEG